MKVLVVLSVLQTAAIVFLVVRVLSLEPAATAPQPSAATANGVSIAVGFSTQSFYIPEFKDKKKK